EGESKVQSPKSKVDSASSKLPASGAQPSTINHQLWLETTHSNRNLSPATGKSYEPLTPKHFSFNAPAGACRVCHGLGQKMVFDADLVVPDQEKSLEQGAIL